jgi:hypothetical protein
MNADLPKALLLSMLAVLAVLFCTVAGVLYVRHAKSAAKKDGWTISLRPSESTRLADAKLESRERAQIATDEELTQMRQRLERKAWEVAQARENEAAKREGREPVQIVAGSDLPAILKYYEDQGAAKTAAQPQKVCSSGVDTASAESLTKSLSGSAWKFSSPAWGAARLEFYEDGGYITSSGIGQWTVPAAGKIVMNNSYDTRRYTVTVSADGQRFDGERSDGLAVFAVLVCEKPPG